MFVDFEVNVKVELDLKLENGNERFFSKDEQNAMIFD